MLPFAEIDILHWFDVLATRIRLHDFLKGIIECLHIGAERRQSDHQGVPLGCECEQREVDQWAIREVILGCIVEGFLDLRLLLAPVTLLQFNCAPVELSFLVHHLQRQQHSGQLLKRCAQNLMASNDRSQSLLQDIYFQRAVNEYHATAAIPLRALLQTPDVPLLKAKLVSYGCLVTHFDQPPAVITALASTPAPDASAMATSIFRAPVYGRRPWATSMLSTINKSSFCHGKTTAVSS